ncbi:hypothetical protein Droror1_Dr00008978 [Drosera rotundifolia]
MGKAAEARGGGGRSSARRKEEEEEGEGEESTRRRETFQSKDNHVEGGCSSDPVESMEMSCGRVIVNLNPGAS